jgi:hypothetical protein
MNLGPCLNELGSHKKSSPEFIPVVEWRAGQRGTGRNVGRLSGLDCVTWQ